MLQSRGPKLPRVRNTSTVCGTKGRMGFFLGMKGLREIVEAG